MSWRVDRVVWRGWWLLLVGLSLAACNTLSAQDIEETVVAGDSIIGTEAAIINATAVVERTQISGTIAVHETHIGASRAVNQVLGATIEAISTPTPQIRVGVMPSPLPSQAYTIGLAGTTNDSGTVDAMPEVISATRVVQNNTDISDSRFTATGITATVDDGGCPVSASTTFPTTVTQLYYTFRVASLSAGTTLRIVWEYNDAPVIEDTWTTPDTYNNVCLWLTLTTANVVFQAGDWAATLYVGDQAVTPRMGFVIE